MPKKPTKVSPYQAEPRKKTTSTKPYQAVKCFIDPEAVLSVELGEHGIEVVASAFVDDFVDPKRWQTRAERRVDVAGVGRPGKEGVQLPISSDAFAYLTQNLDKSAWSEWQPRCYTNSDGSEVHAWHAETSLYNDDGSYHSGLYVTKYEGGAEVYHIHMPVDGQALLLDSLYHHPAMRELTNINMVILPADDSPKLRITPTDGSAEGKVYDADALSKWATNCQIILYSNSYNGPDLQASLKSAIPSAQILLEDTDALLEHTNALVKQQRQQMLANEAIRQYLKGFKSFGAADKALTSPTLPRPSTRDLSIYSRKGMRASRSTTSLATISKGTLSLASPSSLLSSASSTTLSPLTSSPTTRLVMPSTTKASSNKRGPSRRRKKSRAKAPLPTTSVALDPNATLWGKKVSELLRGSSPSTSVKLEPMQPSKKR